MKSKFQNWFSDGVRQESGDGLHILKSSYSWSLGQLDNFRYWNITWSYVAVPKHRSIFWFMVHRKLLTRDRLLSFGIHVSDPQCLQYNDGLESQKLLFFNCASSSQLFKEMVRRTRTKCL